MKKTFLFLLLIACCCAEAFATTQTKAKDCGSVTTCDMRLDSTPANGDVVTIAARVEAPGRTVTFSDDGGSTYVLAACASGEQVNHLSGLPHYLAVGYTLSLTGSAANFDLTVSIDGAPVDIKIVATVHTPAGTPVSFDQCARHAQLVNTAVENLMTSGPTSMRSTPVQWLTGTCAGWDPWYEAGTNLAWDNLIEAGRKLAQESVLVMSAGTEAAEMTIYVDPSIAGVRTDQQCSIMTFDETP